MVNVLVVVSVSSGKLISWIVVVMSFVCISVVFLCGSGSCSVVFM